MKIIEAFQSINRACVKHQSYMAAYEHILSDFCGKKVVFIEVGISSGGSLEGWKNFFAPGSKIIGVDFNPTMQTTLENEGFEIFIGDQADPLFWKNVFREVGPIDILLDDGGHTNEQQIITLRSAIPHVNDGGLILIEDTHTSYMASFMNPYRYSFINYAKLCIDIVNDRFYSLNRYRNQGLIKENIKGVSFFQSIVCFYKDRSQCYISKEIFFGNSDQQSKAMPTDFREKDLEIASWKKSLKNIYTKYFAKQLANTSSAKQIKSVFYFNKSLYRKNRSMKSYFKN